MNQLIKSNIARILLPVLALALIVSCQKEFSNQGGGAGFGTIPDPYEATQWFVSSQVGIWNWERWKSEEYDKLYQDGIAEIDPDKRRDIYLRMQDIMEETGAYVWINHEPEAFVHKTEIVINATPGGDQVYHRFGTA